VQELMREIRHHAISDQVGELDVVLRGHCADYGVAGNIRALLKVYRAVEGYMRMLKITHFVTHRAREWAASSFRASETPKWHPCLLS
jgi:RNA-directed DNA polymerase